MLKSGYSPSYRPWKMPDLLRSRLRPRSSILAQMVSPPAHGPRLFGLALSRLDAGALGLLVSAVCGWFPHGCGPPARAVQQGTPTWRANTDVQASRPPPPEAAAARPRTNDPRRVEQSHVRRPAAV